VKWLLASGQRGVSAAGTGSEIAQRSFADVVAQVRDAKDLSRKWRRK
jgi:hypothetical protein